MKKTFTVSQNCTQEPIDIHEQKTRFPDTRNIIIAQEANEKYEQTTRFPGTRNIIVAQEPIDIHERKIRFPHFRNIIISQEADEKYEQTTRFPGIIGMDSQDIVDPRDQCYAIACSKELSSIHSEIFLAENKTGIITPCKGATL